MKFVGYQSVRPNNNITTLKMIESRKAKPISICREKFSTRK
ncbi:hypothetical protein ASZ90_004988 [hydrocarbon metagenome]|uniref:Uncharacterized protein n=1 Tax=hydrocarbon metagenome TaxID=938273 RepID=A0A0W8FWH2_9ZZZZ